MLRAIISALLVLTLVLSHVFIGDADQTSSCTPGQYLGDNVRQDYSGRVHDGNGFYEYSLHWLKAGLYSYYSLYGKWPDKWADVVDTGLFQTSLINAESQPVDPDDPSLDFFGDLFYTPPQPGENQARISVMRNIRGIVTKYYVLDPPATIQQTYTWMLGNSPAQAQSEMSSYYSSRLMNASWLKQVALATMLMKGLDLYRIVHGHCPYTWDEYLASGLAPITAASINPVTGQHFKGDGSPNDYIYDYLTPEETGTGRDAILFCHIEADGSRAKIRTY